MASSKTSGESRAVDWSEWKHYTKVEVWEAVALSMGIDPLKIERDPDADDHDWRCVPFKEGEKFQQRVRMTVGAGSDHIEIASIAIGRPWENEVKLASFAAWAVSLRWELPQPLKDLVPPSEPEGELSTRERENLLRLIGLLAIAVTEKSVRYESAKAFSSGGLNVQAIADAAKATAKDAERLILNRDGLADKTVREKVKKGLELLQKEKPR